MSAFNLQRISTALPSTSMQSVSAYPATSAGVIPQSYTQIQGNKTAVVYKLIRDGKYKDVIRILTSYVDSESKSRAGQSLLGYAYYMVEDYENAIYSYEMLVKLYPDVDEYRLYYAQCLFKIGQYQSALKIAASITSKVLESKVSRLQSAVKFELNEMEECRLILDDSPKDIDTLIDSASLLFKEGKLDEALVIYLQAQKITGFDAELNYYVALCYFLKKEYTPSLNNISEIVEVGIRDFPELNIGMATEGASVRSIGNSQMLHDSYLIEAFNLKAAVEFQTKNESAAIEALSDMPPRDDHELDSVTLHNQALVRMDTEPAACFEKLNFLLTCPDCPPEVLRNILLLNLKFSYFDVAADILAEFRQSAEATMDASTLKFIDAILLKQSSPDEAFTKLDDLANEYIEILRQTTKQIQEARQDHNDTLLKSSIKTYDETLELFVPVTMAQGKIYWDKEKYDVVEKIFGRSVEFCNEQDAWKLNVAHTLFMQETKYKEAITFYEPLIQKSYENILDVPAIVLANVCVSYIMIAQNEQAEDLMKHVEREEERVSKDENSKRYFHFCIINLVLGTLYCAKGNFEFGISRVMKSMEPFNRKLGTDTWYYAKRCLIALLETLAKQTTVLKDAVFEDILVFLDECDLHGKDIEATTDPEIIATMDISTNTVSYEARLVKSYFLKL